MSTEAKMDMDRFTQLRSALEDAARSYELLAEYVSEISRAGEEDIFQRLALRSANRAVSDLSSSSGSNLSTLYESISAQQKTELRGWWHDIIRREAYRYDELRTRLAWRYLV